MILFRGYSTEPMRGQLASSRKLAQGNKHQSGSGAQLCLGVPVPKSIPHILDCIVYKVPE